MSESLIQIKECPLVGQTWESNDGRLLTIIEEGIWDDWIPYYKYMDINGRSYYSRKTTFYFDFKRKVENVHRTKPTKNN